MFSDLRDTVVAIAMVKTADMTDTVAQVGPRDKADFVTPHPAQGLLVQQSDAVETDYPLSDHTFQETALSLAREIETEKMIESMNAFDEVAN
jgi:hypothetical protein